MEVPAEAQGKAATLVMYIQIGNAWIGLPTKSVDSLGATVDFSGILDNVDFTGASGLQFNVWYGFVLSDGTLYYNAYTVNVQ